MHPLTLKTDKADHLGEVDPQDGRRLGNSPYYNYWETPMKIKLLICYICTKSLGATGAPYLVCDSESGIPQGSWLVGPLVVLLTFHKASMVPSNVELWLSASLSISCGSLSEESYARFKFASITISLIVLGIGSYPWDGSQFGPVI